MKPYRYKVSSSGLMRPVKVIESDVPLHIGEKIKFIYDYEITDIIHDAEAFYGKGETVDGKTMSLPTIEVRRLN